MTGKLLRFIILMAVIVFFIGFNLENRSDIRFWWGEKAVIKSVPIFVSFFVMYLIGVISMVPFLIASSRKRSVGKGKKSGESDLSDPQEKIAKKVRVLGAGKRRQKESKVNSGSTASSTGESQDPDSL